MFCGLSQPPGMNSSVKQKKLDMEGGRVSEERGLELVVRRLGLGLGGWAPVSDVCLAY